MSSTLEAIEADALELTTEERERLVGRLVASVDMDPEVEEAWAAEVERRQALIDDGSAVWVSGPEVLARPRARLS
ncbi:MAG TPA: addiction module protein [Thermoanaerobaculia bacterium]|nr:addiction module protein [Thermoanaerobaculia bacterium]